MDPKGLAVGVAQVALRAIGQANVADMLGDLVGVSRPTAETLAYQRFVRSVETNLTALRRGAVASHRSQAEEIDAALEQVRVRFETLLTDEGPMVAMAHLKPNEFRARVRDESARKLAHFGGIGPQVYEDALAHVTEAFIAFAPSLPQFATVMLTVIADGVADAHDGIGRLEANDLRLEGKLDSVLSGLSQIPARTGLVRTGTLPGRAPDFVDTGILDRLAEQVAHGGQSTRVSLTGLRGTGKTQVAAEFARRCLADGWPVIAWVNAGSQGSLTTDLTVLANEIVGVRDGEATETLLARWRAAWNSDPDPRRLIVLDNLTDATHVRSLLPDDGAATVIATMADARAMISRHALDVTSWTPEQAVGYLAVRTGLDDPDGAQQVAEEVGFLPLALAQAAWVIGQRRRRRPLRRGKSEYGFAEYAVELDGLPLDRVLTAERGGEYLLKTAQAIELSVQATLDACEDDGLGPAVLGVLAHLDPVGIPTAWLDVLDDAAEQVGDILDAMEAGALVMPSQDGATIVMHRLVGRLLRGRSGTQWDEVSGQVADVLASVDPLTTDSFWEQRQNTTLVNSHVLATLGYSGSDDVGERLIDIALHCGYALNVLHLPEPAIALLERITVTAERILGPDHPTTLTSRNSLASAYESVGDLSRAISMYEQTLADRERVLGLDHEHTLVSRNNLAYTYQVAGDLGRAIPLLEQTLADRERVLGLDHSHTLVSRNNLAHALRVAGDLRRAIPLSEQTLADRERVMGTDHPDTHNSRNNLAAAYASAGDLSRAIPLLEQVLKDMQRVLGTDHPDTLNSRNNLAGAYESAGDLSQAISMYEKNLADRERVMGPDHPSTLISRNNLAYAHQAAGDLGRAISLFEQNFKDTRRVLGLDHPGTLTSRVNLAAAYDSAGDLGRAIPLFEQTVTDAGRVLGSDHPDTLTSINNLASAYESAGDLGRAIPMFEQVLTDREQILGSDHPDTLTSISNLAGAYDSAGDLDRAMPLFKQALVAREQVLGPDHPDTLSSRNNLAYAHRVAGELDQAISIYEQTLTARERVLGPDHPSTLWSRNELALTLPQIGRHDRALELAKTNGRLSAERFGPTDPRTLDRHDTVGYILAAAGDVDAATETWRSAHATALDHLGADHEITLLLAERLGRN